MEIVDVRKFEVLNYFLPKFADPRGFEPLIFCSTSRRVNRATLWVHLVKTALNQALLRNQILCRRPDSNRQPWTYDVPALPLSYTGVAGPRFARGPKAYETFELLLLHPARYKYFIINYNTCKSLKAF